ncbi:peptidase M23-like protein [Brevirhabdus pacifica]|nr:peptidase M23-like protein [Brevirhabdus pacifica]
MTPPAQPAPELASPPPDPLAEAPRLMLPLECELGLTCDFQNLVDHDPGPGTRDFQCGPLTYDGHMGTDIRVPDLAAMEAGVTVRAAAAGRVLRRRDGMADNDLAPLPVASGQDARDCGNGVLLDHGGGWQTQYCHMARGSVSVRAGDELPAGAPLGRVGLSGRTEFPHLHFSVTYKGQEVDPFSPTDVAQCPLVALPEGQPAPAATEPAPTLWEPPLRPRPGGFMRLGFSTALPELDQLRRGGVALKALPADAPALVLWGFGFAARGGDEVLLRIDGPDGPLVDRRMPVEAPQAQFFRAAGLKREGEAWPPGPYTGLVELWRQGKRIDSGTLRIDLDQ